MCLYLCLRPPDPPLKEASQEGELQEGPRYDSHRRQLNLTSVTYSAWCAVRVLLRRCWVPGQQRPCIGGSSLADQQLNRHAAVQSICRVMQSTLAYRLETQQPEWAKLARLCRLEVDQVLHIAESVSELTFDGLLAAEAPASLHVQMYETTDTMLATVRRIVDVCEMLSMWPAGLIGLARLVKKKPHALLRATRLELVGLDLEVASGSLKYGATMCGVMAAIFLCGLEQLPADSFTRGPRA